MTRILLSGCNGKMGRVITDAVKEREDASVVAGIDPNTEITAGYQVFASPAGCNVPADVIIDFSHPAALVPLLTFARERGLPIVVATTGLGPDAESMLRETAEHVAVFHSANMSLGVNLMLELCKIATRVLGRDFDIEIIEKHHNQKIDAPSGTAFMLADEIAAQFETPPRYEFDRHSKRQKRTREEIGLHAVRGGTIVGEHDVLFAGRDEIITISHSARSKEIFATGALNAALFLCGKKPGLYTMAELI